jgi:hypothetical protein
MGNIVVGKTISVTGRGYPKGYGTSRLSQFLENLLTDPARLLALRAGRPPLNARKISDSEAVNIRYIAKLNDHIGKITHVLPT